MKQVDYRVRALDGDRFVLERLFNEQAADGYELTTLSFTEHVAIFEKQTYIEHRSKEHIDAVLAAVKSYGDVHDLEFLADVAYAADGTPPVQQVLADDEAWRFLIDRILGES